MIFIKNPQEGLPFNPYLSPDGQVKLLFWIPQTVAVGGEEPPPSSIGVASNGFGLLFTTGRG